MIKIAAEGKAASVMKQMRNVQTKNSNSTKKSNNRKNNSQLSSKSFKSKLTNISAKRESKKMNSTNTTGEKNKNSILDKLSEKEKKQVENILNLLYVSPGKQKEFLKNLDQGQLNSLKNLLEGSLQEFFQKLGLSNQISNSKIKQLKLQWKQLKLNLEQISENLDFKDINKDIKENSNILDLLNLTSEEKKQLISGLSAEEKDQFNQVLKTNQADNLKELNDLMDLTSFQKEQLISNLSAEEKKQLHKILNNITEYLKNSNLYSKIEAEPIAKKDLVLVKLKKLQDILNQTFKKLDFGNKVKGEKISQALNQTSEFNSKRNIQLPEIKNLINDSGLKKLTDFYSNIKEENGKNSLRNFAGENLSLKQLNTSNKKINLKELINNLNFNQNKSNQVISDQTVSNQSFSKENNLFSLLQNQNISNNISNKDQLNFQGTQVSDANTSISLSSDSKEKSFLLNNKQTNNMQNSLNTFTSFNKVNQSENSGLFNQNFNLNQGNTFNSYNNGLGDNITGQNWGRKDIINQITDQIKFHHRSGSNNMKIKLKPDFLGKVKLDLQVESGEVKAKFMVENIFVKEQLSENLSLLENNLNQSGLDVDNIEVESNPDDFEENQDSDLQEENNQENGENQNHKGNFWKEQEQFQNKSIEEIMEEVEKKGENSTMEVGRWLALNQYFNRVNLLA